MPTHFQGSSVEQRALSAYICLMRAAQSVTARLATRRGKDGLTITQLAVLEALLHLGPLRAGDLADKLLTTGGNVTHVVDNLERDGLVQRARSGEDRRSITLKLTSAGRKRIADLFPRHAREIATEFAVLRPGEQAELQRLCRILGKQERNNAKSRSKS